MSITSETRDDIHLQLGDIIQIHSPANTNLHEKIFIINYIDSFKIKLINDKTIEETILTINDLGKLNDESIESIDVLNRDSESGFARQNGLIPDKWVDIYFTGWWQAIVVISRIRPCATLCAILNGGTYF